MSIIFVIFETWGVGVGEERTGLEDLRSQAGFICVAGVMEQTLFSVPSWQGPWVSS